MKNILNKIKSWFPKKGLNKDQQIIMSLINAFTISQNHLIAMARLTFIKPEVLNREAKNIKSNAEYLFKMIEAEKEKKWRLRK